MKIEWHKHRSRTNPTNGVTLTAAERKAVNINARLYEALPLGELALLRDALAGEIVWLESIHEWTTDELEVIRHEKHLLALLTYFAVDAAHQRDRVEAVYRFSRNG